MIFSQGIHFVEGKIFLSKYFNILEKSPCGDPVALRRVTHCVLPQHLGVSHQREKLSALCSQSFYHNFELLQIRQEAQREKSICRRAE